MKKLIGLSLSIALAWAAFAAVPVTADPDGSDPDAAVIVRVDGACRTWDGDGRPVSADLLYVLNSHRGITVCKAKGVPNSTGAAVRYDADDNPVGPDQPCRTELGPTLEWHQTVSAKGNLTLVCRVPVPA